MKKILFNLILIMILAGCSGDGIFYNLEKEEKIEDANNMGSSTPLDQILIYTAGSNKYYVTNGKKVWYSLIGTDTNSWATYPVPAGYKSDATFPSIALLNGELYATVISHDADYRSGLLKYNSSTEKWTEILFNEKETSSTGKYDYSNMYLFDTDQGLYINKVSYNMDDDYEVSIKNSQLYFYATSDEGTLAASSELSASNLVTFPGFNIPSISTESDPQRIVEIVSGNGNETYMIYNIDGSANKNGVLAYSASDPGSFSLEDTGFDYDFISIYYSPVQDMVLMGTESSGDSHPILYKKSSGSWYLKSYSDDYEFSTFCDINSIQSNTILAGTRAFKDPSSSSSILGDGYREIVVSDPASATGLTIRENVFSEDNNYSSSDLEDASINSFLYDSNNDRLYATTTSYGLWLNTVSGSDREWAQE